MFLVVAILPVELIAFHFISVSRLNGVIRESNLVILLGSTLNRSLGLCLLRSSRRRTNLSLTLLRISLRRIALLRVSLLRVALPVFVSRLRRRRRRICVVAVRIIAVVVVGIVSESISVIRVAVVTKVRVAAKS